jgi:hypothetical protein
MNRWSISVVAAVFVAIPAAAQRFGPDYSQRGLPGGGDTVAGGGDLTGSDSRPVGCIFQFSHRIPRPDLLDLIKSGYAAKTSKQKMTFQLVGETIAACRDGNGWSPKRQDIALRFFSARVLTDDALYQGREFGLTAAVVRALDAKLAPDAKAAFASGKVDNAHLVAAMTQLPSAGLDTASLTPEQIQRLAPLVAQALWGLYRQSEAAAAYKAA